MDTPANAITDAAPPTIAAAPLAPGALIAERYRLEARLGAGGGGTVWRCLDDKLGAIVALKIVSSGGDLERWRREVAMARRIASRNVCRVHDLGEAGGLRFVTMELVEGDSLRARIRHGLPAATTRDLFAQIVAGTAAIHAAGVVHRDLKPENIVVARDGRAVIVDFGLAREPRIAGAAAGSAAPLDSSVTIDMRGAIAPGPPASATVTNAGAVLGTPRYMSPEQAAGQAVDARTDVWALGLIGHELITGTLPPPDEHGRRIDPAVDAAWQGLAAVLRRCLAFLPDERPADARQLEHALAAIGRRRRRKRWAVGAAGLIAILAAIVAAAVTGTGTGTGTGTDTGTVASGPPSPPVAAVRASRMFQLTTTEAKKWPGEAPISVALSADATQLAYTTAEPRLLVRATDGDKPVAWSMPALEKPRSRPTDAPESSLTTMWAAGWFSDGSIALVGTHRDNEHRLDRVYPDGRSQLLYRHAQRFIAAVTPVRDRVVVGTSDHAISVISPADGAPEQIATTGHNERVLALAWSPDGTRIAVARLLGETGDAAAIQVMSATGGDARELWRGSLTSIAGQLLAWIDRDRLAFASNDLTAGRARLFTLDARSRAVEPRGDWPATYVGAGSAAGGTLLLLRGPATFAVAVGDKRGRDLVRLHDRGVRARHLAGWTSDGRVVFAVGEPGKERIVRGAPGQALQVWPGTHDGVELPDSLVGDDLIAHRLDQTSHQIIVERITPAGARTELTRLPAVAATSTVGGAAGGTAGSAGSKVGSAGSTADSAAGGAAGSAGSTAGSAAGSRGALGGPGDGALVRCAGDRSAPCIVAQAENGLVGWADLDPDTTTRGPWLHQRPLREGVAPSAALSADGKLLAIVDGGHTLTLIDRTTGQHETRSAGEGVALQSVSFAPDGDVWVTAIGFKGRLFGLMTFDKLGSGALSSSPWSRGSSWNDTLRWFERPSPSPDGNQLAIATLELALDVWRADGL